MLNPKEEQLAYNIVKICAAVAGAVTVWALIALAIIIE